MQTFLFFTRLALYATLVAVPYMIDDAVVVAYDRSGKFAYFLLVPLMMCAAYFLRPPRVRWWVGPLTALGILVFAMAALAGFEFHMMLFYLGLGLGAYVLTRLVFGQRGMGLAAFEMFFFGLVYFKILSFTRSAEEIARENAVLIKALLVLAVISFLIHGIVLYLAAFPDRSRERRRRELLIFGVLAVPLLALLSFGIPLDYVQNQIALNENREEPEPQPLEEGEGDRDGAMGKDSRDSQNGLPLGDGEEKYPSERQGGGGQELEDVPERGTRPDENRGGRGGQRSDKQEGEQGGSQSEEGQDKGEGQLPGSRSGRGQNGGQGGGRGNQGKQQQGEGNRSDQKVEGVPADQWNNIPQSAQGTHQLAEMVIVSPVQPVYAAQEYRGAFDAEQGLVRTPEEREPLNELARLHLVETWQDQVATRDDKREPVEIFYLSTQSERVLAYRPFRIQPTIQNTRYHPFNLSYHAISRVSLSDPEDWKLVRDLSPTESERMSDELRVELAPEIERDFRAHLSRASGQKKQYFAKIEAILKSFNKHQYELGFDEDVSPAKLRNFLTQTKAGDCTEFAHTAALLGRMAGIPSRVVVGYLASTDMQTQAHVRGAHELRKKIKPLQEYPLEEIYLITSSHRHAWVQYFLPGFGWVDFESTAFAIPPKPEHNPNNLDVLIPMIEEHAAPQAKPAFQFPWRLALKVVAVAAVGVLLLLYLLRNVREWYYYFASRGRSRRALKARFTYLLMRLAREGHPLRAAYQTSLEYAQDRAALRPFAATYTTLLFKQNFRPGEEAELWGKLEEQSREAVRELRRPGGLSVLRRLFSLRSLYY